MDLLNHTGRNVQGPGYTEEDMEVLGYVRDNLVKKIGYVRAEEANSADVIFKRGG